MRFIDLHTHSTCSDGILRPAELVSLAAECGLKAMALTDHDTLAGVEEAVAAGRACDLEVIAGLEVSAWHDNISMHILGYWLDPDHAGLQKKLRFIQAARRERNEGIMAKLNRLGIKTSMAELAGYADGGQIGRPHIARLLVARGVVPSVNKAFAMYLKKGASAYKERFRFGADQAIAMIREAGGLAVLAHPGQLDPSGHSLPSLLAGLKEMGLAGVEVLYPSHNGRMVKLLKKAARDLNLVVSGGSDLHGGPDSQLALALKEKKFYVPYYLLEIMKETAGKGEGEIFDL